MSAAIAIADCRQAPRWLHAWAVLTACATLPLLLLGAEVTTKKVGMADPQGFRLPWHLWTVHDLWSRGLGYLIEHSHRLAGFTVGICVIVLALGLWRKEPRRAVRLAGLAALAAIIVQGLLGGFRVQLNALMGPRLALVHGCFAQLVFALLVSLALVTARGWSAPAPLADLALRRWTLLTACLVYLQVMLGALVRHTDSWTGPRLHLLAAFAVLGAVLRMAHLVYDAHPRSRALVAATALLAGLLVLQLGLGVEAWLARFPATPEWAQGMPPTLAAGLPRTLHSLVGAWVFSAAVATALTAYRGVVWFTDPEAAPIGRLEGVA